ncbi:LuxR C-terminal-related transcriptional regulator [Flavobacterium eburneipallidum]|uniref:LuxR C-terminal-related transcriptional regulator n=1 Tax=Flavobacterium eburneipallidum TaxID=3003263 RepID=UPI0024824958|nr:LuxR C-terminal-related transcriptional regulator [Flavobacterium eburneipallidum]
MEKSNSNFYLAAKKIWGTVAKSDSEYTLDLEQQLEFHKQLLNLLQVGPFYYFIFNIFQGEFDFISDSVKEVLGYEPQEMTTRFLLENVHPEDKDYLLHYENKSIAFFKSIPFEKIKNYKAQYDFRIKTKNDTYIRILQQIIPIDYNETNFYKSLGLQTDISHIKKEGIPCFSIIGMNGEPSYHNIKDSTVFTKTYDIFTKREREVLKLIVEGKSSKAIADELNISLHTVNTHRKKLLTKADCKSPIDLVTKVINEGWI